MRIVYPLISALSLAAFFVTLVFALGLVETSPDVMTGCTAVLGVGSLVNFGHSFTRARVAGQFLSGLIGSVLALACLAGKNGIIGQPLLVITAVLLAVNTVCLAITAVGAFQRPLRTV